MQQKCYDTKHWNYALFDANFLKYAPRAEHFRIVPLVLLDGLHEHHNIIQMFTMMMMMMMLMLRMKVMMLMMMMTQASYCPARGRLELHCAHNCHQQRPGWGEIFIIKIIIIIAMMMILMIVMIMMMMTLMSQLPSAETRLRWNCHHHHHDRHYDHFHDCHLDDYYDDHDNDEKK